MKLCSVASHLLILLLVSNYVLVPLRQQQNQTSHIKRMDYRNPLLSFWYRNEFVLKNRQFTQTKMNKMKWKKKCRGNKTLTMLLIIIKANCNWTRINVNKITRFLFDNGKKNNRRSSKQQKKSNNYSNYNYKSKLKKTKMQIRARPSEIMEEPIRCRVNNYL